MIYCTLLTMLTGLLHLKILMLAPSSLRFGFGPNFQPLPRRREGTTSSLNRSASGFMSTMHFSKPAGNSALKGLKMTLFPSLTITVMFLCHQKKSQRNMGEFLYCRVPTSVFPPKTTIPTPTFIQYSIASSNHPSQAMTVKAMASPNQPQMGSGPSEQK